MFRLQVYKELEKLVLRWHNGEYDSNVICILLLLYKSMKHPSYTERIIDFMRVTIYKYAKSSGMTNTIISCYFEAGWVIEPKLPR